ncbi:hypothetical protein GCM10022416_22200 [Actinomadura keratinilytica]|uniref:Tn3 transposase DDE domain-containing protein n=1 Tax=Actinomadura keratinilytica TaxID=547461 RepID=A0ABP7YKN3_9ACTN
MDSGPGILFQVRLAHAATDLGTAPNITDWNHLADRTLQIGGTFTARKALTSPHSQPIASKPSPAWFNAPPSAQTLLRPASSKTRPPSPSPSK